MCNPVMIVAGALEVGGQIANHVAKSKAAKQNKQLAQEDMKLQFADVNARLVEEQKAAANQIQAGLKQKNDAQGSALAAAAGANVGGLSVEALLHTIEGDAASFTDSVNEQLEGIERQAQRDRRAVIAGTANRIAQVPNPSLIGTGLRIGGSIVEGIDRYKRTQPNNGKGR